MPMLHLETDPYTVQFYAENDGMRTMASQLLVNLALNFREMIDTNELSPTDMAQMSYMKNMMQHARVQIGDFKQD
jgi:hypothetical protein